ncbi:hypothetical protein NR996_02000 [Lactobacillus rodentium]|nr:hypothetical protein [Lactobacillus rodentium]MCR1894185.1 hypothetical protein [Lactobacillus rodentium]
MKKKIIKRILIILGIVIGVTGLTIVSVQTTNRVIENRKAKKMEEAKKKKIKEEKEHKKEREKIALWVVQNIEGPEPIKSLEISEIRRNGIGGTGGSSVSVKINNNDNNSFDLSVDGEVPMKGGAFISSNCKYEFTKKEIKSRTLKGIKIEEWKEK